MQAIKTKYKGIEFRSRLEARWAIFFDALGLKWEYEPEGFVQNNGTKYLPDFYVHNLNYYDSNGCLKTGIYIEVKGELTYDDVNKIDGFNKPLYVVGNVPNDANAWDGVAFVYENVSDYFFSYFDGGRLDGPVWFGKTKQGIVLLKRNQGEVSDWCRKECVKAVNSKFEYQNNTNNSFGFGYSMLGNIAKSFEYMFGDNHCDYEEAQRIREEENKRLEEERKSIKYIDVNKIYEALKRMTGIYEFDYDKKLSLVCNHSEIPVDSKFSRNYFSSERGIEIKFIYKNPRFDRLSYSGDFAVLGVDEEVEYSALNFALDKLSEEIKLLDLYDQSKYEQLEYECNNKHIEIVEYLAKKKRREEERRRKEEERQQKEAEKLELKRQKEEAQREFIKRVECVTLGEILNAFISKLDGFDKLVYRNVLINAYISKEHSEDTMVGFGSGLVSRKGKSYYMSNNCIKSDTINGHHVFYNKSLATIYVDFDCDDDKFDAEHESWYRRMKFTEEYTKVYIATIKDLKKAKGIE